MASMRPGAAKWRQSVGMGAAICSSWMRTGVASQGRGRDPRVPPPASTPLASVGSCAGSYTSDALPGLQGDNQIIATACMDSLCHLLSATDGRILQSLKVSQGWEVEENLTACQGHTGEVNSLNFQRRVSGELTNRLVSGSDDMTCMVWDVERGLRPLLPPLVTLFSPQVPYCLPLFLLPSSSPPFSPQSLTSRSGLPVQTLAGEHEEAVYGVRFHRTDACLVASVAFDRMGFLWDLRQKAAALRLEGHRDDVIGLDFSPCGKFLATGSDDCTCRLWDLRRSFSTLDELQHPMEVKRIAWSPCGRWIATGSSDCSAYVWSTERMPCTLEGKLEGHSAQVPRALLRSPG
eukprot:751395-Hanusia_phi.AAC.3